MSFYTNVNKYGNSILYRGYSSDGRRVTQTIKDFRPKLFTRSSKRNTEWKGLDGYFLDEYTAKSMNDAIEFENRYKETNLKPYGNTNLTSQFITSKFPDEIKFDRNRINVTSIDIEVQGDQGFPSPKLALYPITAITTKNNIDNVYYVWGLNDFSISKSYMKKNEVVYTKCSSESDLLDKFLSFWLLPKNCPDIVTGWNIRFFDIPYIVNRIRNLFGPPIPDPSELENPKDRRRPFKCILSPWNLAREESIVIKGKNELKFFLYGIAQLDYMELFKKFAFVGPQESYSLNNIAHTMLGEKKISYDEYGDLTTLYKKDHQKFIDYNIKDVELVDRLEEKMGLITLAMTMAYKGGTNYNDVMGTTAIWDSIIYRELNKKKIVPWYNERHKFYSKIAGGYVKPVKPGIYDWVVSFDLNSLYPNIIVQNNVSPETITPERLHRDAVPVNPEAKAEDQIVQLGNYYLDSNNKFQTENAVAANGSTYSKKKLGVLPSIIIDWYDERRSIKNMMLAAQKQYQKKPTIELDKEINHYHNQQMSIKLLMNSLYGALANKYFRYFDSRMAEGITLSGQLAVKWAERSMNESMNKLLETKDKDYVIAIDTDSLYIDFSEIIKKFNPKNPVSFLDKITQSHFESSLKKSYDKLFGRMNSYKNRMEMGREVIADRGIWLAKKRYILNVHNSEGVQYTEPKLKIMGIEAIKSSTPEVVRSKFKEIFKIIITGSEKDTQKYIKDFRNEFYKLKPEEVSFPRGVSDINKYHDPSQVFKKGTPIHVRGSLLYNKRIKELGLTNRYDYIYNGDKIKFCYLAGPHHGKQNVIAFPDFLPRELQLHNHIDYNMQFEKTFIEPLKLILDAINWKVEEVATLDDLFG